ncbi:hypothetical protein SCA6_015877 [Theobroma cacao]
MRRGPHLFNTIVDAYINTTPKSQNKPAFSGFFFVQIECIDSGLTFSQWYAHLEVVEWPLWLDFLKQEASRRQVVKYNI